MGKEVSTANVPSSKLQKSPKLSLRLRVPGFEIAGLKPGKAAFQKPDQKKKARIEKSPQNKPAVMRGR